MHPIKSDAILKTLVCAYVWVASADQKVRVVEFKKYERAILQSPFATQFDSENVRHYFKDMVRLFDDNLQDAVELTKSRLKEIAENEFVSQEVIRLCRVAAVGDGVVTESEELVMKEINAILGFSNQVI